MYVHLTVYCNWTLGSVGRELTLSLQFSYHFRHEQIVEGLPPLCQGHTQPFIQLCKLCKEHQMITKYTSVRKFLDSTSIQTLQKYRTECSKKLLQITSKLSLKIYVHMYSTYSTHAGRLERWCQIQETQDKLTTLLSSTTNHMIYV